MIIFISSVYLGFPPFWGPSPFVLVYQQSCQRGERHKNQAKQKSRRSQHFGTFASVFVYLSGQVSTLWFLDHLRYWNIFVVAAKRRGVIGNHFSWLTVVRVLRLQLQFLRLSLLLLLASWCAIAFVMFFCHMAKKFSSFSSDRFGKGEQLFGRALF